MPMNTPACAAHAKVTYRQLDHWLRKGFVPDYERDPESGSGHPRFLTDEQVDFVVRLARLVHAGVDVSVAAHALALLEADVTAFYIAPDVRVELV